MIANEIIHYFVHWQGEDGSEASWPVTSLFEGTCWGNDNLKRGTKFEIRRNNDAKTLVASGQGNAGKP